MIYLDWNATTPPLPAVLDAMRDAARLGWANPSSTHAAGRAARAFVEDARAAVGDLAGVDPRDVILTSGGTEANNLALRSAFAGGAGGTLLTSRLEHPSITRVAEALVHEGRAHVRWIAVTPAGMLDLEDLAAALASEPNVRLLAVQAVNHETGVIQPVADAIVLARRHRVAVHVDAVQAFGKIAETGIDADTRSLAAHKIRGPKSIGALVTRPGARISPVLVGGAQERGIRPGTLDPLAAAGLAVAARHAKDGAARHLTIAPRRDALERALCDLPAAPQVVGAGPRAPHVTNLSWPGWIGAELVAALDLEGLSVSSGSACSAGTIEPSPVVTAMLGEKTAGSSVRMSLGDDTTDVDVAAAIAVVQKVTIRFNREVDR